MLLIHAAVHTMDTKEIPCGFVQVQGKTIAAVGDMADCPAPAAGEQVIDLTGRLLLPGFLDAHSHIGLWEDSIGKPGDDLNEWSEPITPHLRAIDAINPFDRYFSEACAAGVTCAVVGPGSSNPIAGQICALKTSGRWVEQMAVAEPLAIKFALGENPKRSYGARAKMPYTRMATCAMIREQLEKTRRYLLEKHVAECDPDTREPAYDARCEALIPLLRGQIRAHFHAHKAYDILSAVRIAKEFGLKYTIIHCTEGYLIADILAENGVDAVCGPLICTRTKPELAGLMLENCTQLMQAGVNVAICTDHPEVPADFLALSAALAVNAGLNRQKALEAVTIGAARAVALDHRIGSITPAKDADLLVFSGDPLALGVRPEMVFIGGERVV